VEAGQWSNSLTGQLYGLDFWCVLPRHGIYEMADM
jgi:hypothetical protein